MTITLNLNLTKTITITIAITMTMTMTITMTMTTIMAIHTYGPSYQETPKMNELDIVGKKKMPRRANFAKF